uniref:Uncharacterized protein n=1 Tax=Rhizophora mucronata TaxID=61149 RepID=A0A2P2PE94_RHIMU
MPLEDICHPKICPKFSLMTPSRVDLCCVSSGEEEEAARKGSCKSQSKRSSIFQCLL